MYYLLYGLLYLISLLPFFILYGVSDIVSFFMYHVIKYRREIVMTNLCIAFPDKTENERKRIAKQFYRNFNDTWVESIKMLSMSSSRLNKRISSNGEDIFSRLKEKGQSSQLLYGA